MEHVLLAAGGDFVDAHVALADDEHARARLTLAKNDLALLVTLYVSKAYDSRTGCVGQSAEKTATCDDV